MNDRFKFKFWDKTIKKMRYGDIQLACNGQPFVLEDSSKGLKVVDIDDIKILQCTGIKDKNGKLIDEGDIVKFSSIYGHGIFEIKWNDEFAMYGFEDEETNFTDLRYFIENGVYIEILGNLYENPELLETKNG